MSTVNVSPQVSPNENEDESFIEVDEILARLAAIEAGQKDINESIKSLEKRTADCEDSIDALAE